MDDMYLLNSPFTFQAMEKHAAYCAMIRLGLEVPDDRAGAAKNPMDNERWAYTASKYNLAFDLDEVATRVGLPAVHEAVRRRRLASGCPGSTTRPSCTRPTTSPGRC